MIKADDFNMVISEYGETYIRLNELNKLIDCGAISVDEEKLEQYKKDTRDIESALEKMKKQLGDEFDIHCSDGVIVFEPVYHVKYNQMSSRYDIYNEENELITIFHLNEMMDAMKHSRIVVINK